MRVDYRRAKITTPEGSIRGRFVFRDGRAAVLVEDRATKAVSRILFSTDATFVRAETARYPHTVQLNGSSVEWQVKQLHGGGSCCGKAQAPLFTVNMEDALADEFTV